MTVNFYFKESFQLENPVFLFIKIARIYISRFNFWSWTLRCYSGFLISLFKKVESSLGGDQFLLNVKASSYSFWVPWKLRNR